MTMQPLVDSTDLLDKPDALRVNAARDGYLLIRGLLPEEDVAEAGIHMAGVMAEAGWIAPGEPLETAVANLDKFCVEPQTRFMQVFYRQLGLRSMHALRLHPNLVGFFDMLFDEECLPVPHFVTRLAFPEHADYATPAHQDYVHFEGSLNNWAAWVPFTTVDEARGGIAIASGSHKDGPYEMRPALGAGQMVIDTNLDQLDWRWSEMAPGDVLIHNCLTVHKGLPNSTNAMRVSVDYRYQPLADPISEKHIGVSHQMRTWEELYAGWDDRNDPLKFYWEQFDLKVEPFTYTWYDRRDELAIEMGEKGDPEALVALENITLKHRDESMRERAQVALDKLNRARANTWEEVMSDV